MSALWLVLMLWLGVIEPDNAWTVVDGPASDAMHEDGFSDHAYGVDCKPGACG